MKGSRMSSDRLSPLRSHGGPLINTEVSLGMRERGSVPKHTQTIAVPLFSFPFYCNRDDQSLVCVELSRCRFQRRYDKKEKVAFLSGEVPRRNTSDLHITVMHFLTEALHRRALHYALFGAICTAFNSDAPKGALHPERPKTNQMGSGVVALATKKMVEKLVARLSRAVGVVRLWFAAYSEFKPANGPMVLGRRYVVKTPPPWT
ncbi:hypothetical protein F2P81_024469 [Scophthalmus maximus]|uniref:Uncharacterized protein n=1 Tax=Scophthalmus maximus TaxID=52904 RepID=A0A6A4RU98_SCOMX|nr:hypothetical protein F2P81_024469 [Scophthalmus maximus]